MGTYHISQDELEDEIIGLMEDLEGKFTLENFIKATKNAWKYLSKRQSQKN